MQRLGLMILVVFFAIPGFAKNEFGDLDDVRVKHPEFFKPGVVTVAQLGQEDWYVYCGDAEKCLKSELDDELYDEAQVQAKMNFFNHFARKDPSVKVDVTGARRMYQYADNEFRLVVMGVPVKGVAVRHDLPKAANVEDKKDPALELNALTNEKAQFPKAEESVPETKNAVEKVKVIAPQADGAVVKAVEKEEPPCEKGLDQKINVHGMQEEVTDDEKLDILRKRITANPNDYRTRLKMARIFARQGKVRRAFNNYNDAARTLISDASVLDADKCEDLIEIAHYEEFAKEYAFALKHYRMALKIGDRDQIRKANDRISFLLLKF